MKLILCSLISIFFLISCKENRHQKSISSNSIHRVFIIQPLNKFDAKLLNAVNDSLKHIFPNVQLQSNIQLPKSLYNQARGRFRADSIIHYLNARASNQQIIVGLINTDISTTKGNYADWGVMGLGYCPGKACVISTFRLDKKSLFSQLHKVVIHEIGHTLGLPHCTIKTCYMRDAEGHNTTDEETEFCKKCKSMFNTRILN